MEIELTADQQAFARRAMESGRLQSEADAVREGMAMWEERERRRVELIAMREEAGAAVEAGDYTDWTDETLPQLFAELRGEILGEAKDTAA